MSLRRDPNHHPTSLGKATEVPHSLPLSRLSKECRICLPGIRNDGHLRYPDRRSGQMHGYVIFLGADTSAGSDLTLKETYLIPGPQIFSGVRKPKVFCKRCGCTIYTLPGRGRGKMAMLRTPLIDGYADVLSPSEEWFTRDRLAWCPRLVDEGKCFEDMKPTAKAKI